MKCKDCGNFKTNGHMEAGAEISPNVRTMKGKCAINDKDCKASDNCGCGEFSTKGLK